jgi:hypothetical protein
VFEWLRAPMFFDVVIGILVIEGAVLARYTRRTGKGMPLPQLASFLGAGAGFAIACRALAAGWPAWTLIPALTAALICHLLHLRASR